MDSKVQTPHFICGMSRGGTTWLGFCLNEHPDVAVFGETLYWGRYYVEPELDGRYSANDIVRISGLQKTVNRAFYGDSIGCLKHLDADLWSATIQAARDENFTPGELFSYLADEVAKYERKRVVLEKTPHHLNHIERISNSFPDARFIIMVRDPYSFMLSYKNQGLQKSRERQQALSKYFHPLGCALVWKGYARQTLKSEKVLADRALIVRFEELKNKSELIWVKVAAFLKVPQVPMPVIADKNSSFSQVERPELQRVDLFWMNLVAGGLIRDLGYELKKSGLPVWLLLKSSFSLFPWMWYLYSDISKRTTGGIFKYGYNWIKKGFR